MKQEGVIIVVGLFFVTVSLFASPACAFGFDDTDEGMCLNNLECPSLYQYCDKPTGNCDGVGLCAERPEVCVYLWDPVCGCDGNTYGNACEAAAAGVSIDHEGECIPAYCWDNTMCAPTDYCFFKECALETGVCMPRPEACLDIWLPVCGCDGATYSNECYAAMAGVSVDYEGECRPTLCPGDFNHDGRVDEKDLRIFAEPFGKAGPENFAGFYPADINKDYDVDGEDLSGLASDYGDIDCLVPRIVSYENSGCLPNTEFGSEATYPGCGDDSVEFDVSEQRIQIIHRNATYNCCPEDIQVSLRIEGNLLRIVEEEIGGVCLCLCCYDVKTQIAVPPGEYVLKYCWQDFETGEECYEKKILVP